MRKAISSFLLFVGISVSVFSQSAKIDSLKTMYDNMYGLDMLLHNGEKYVPEVSAQKGIPFWKDKAFKGDVFLRGEVFRNRTLRYDINKQKFVYLYTDYNEQPHQVVLNSSVLDSVRTYDGAFFVKNQYPEISSRFLQLIFDGEIICYIGHKKNLSFKSQGADIGYIYSNEIRSFFLIYEGQLFEIHGKKDFIKIFPKDKRHSIRKFMSSHKMKFKDIEDSELKDLIVYCENITD